MLLRRHQPNQNSDDEGMEKSVPSFEESPMHKYLKDHILDEIDGAIDYMTKAVEHKKDEWGSVFCRMAQMELDHANALTKMYMQIEKPKTVTDAEYSEMTKSILNSYAEGMGKVEAMKKLYWE